MAEDYQKQQKSIISNKIVEALDQLPDCCREYYNYMLLRNKSIRTCLNYMNTYQLFFNYVTTHKLENKSLKLFDKDITKITYHELEKITENDIDSFLVYIGHYTWHGKELVNNPRALNNKLSAIKSLYRYLMKKNKISVNRVANAECVIVPENKQEPVHLEVDQAAKLISVASEYQGSYCKSRQSKSANALVKYRDLAILLIFCSTGLRVSELVGLNYEDIDFRDNSLTVIRKGASKQKVYMNDESIEALNNYLTIERSVLLNQNKENKALFLSLKHNRLSVRSVETLVNKYSLLIDGCKVNDQKSKISPHRLRATYASLFLENDIGSLKELSENMGHSSIDTTTIYTGTTKSKVRQNHARKLKIQEP